MSSRLDGFSQQLIPVNGIRIHAVTGGEIADEADFLVDPEDV